MKKIYFLIITAILFTGNSFAQVTVTGADAVTNGLSPFTTLGAAFSSINGNAQTGNVISITITANTAEPATATLNAGAWTSVNITTAGVYTISGNLAGPLVDLNGADNLTIDGFAGGSVALTLDNQNASASASTVRFINDATANSITRCNLLGSTGAAVSSGLGTVFFGVGTSSGNDNNTINQCNFAASAGGTPVCHIYSAGFSTAVDNSGISITTNNIADYFNASGSAGINVNNNSSAWTILANALYQTAARTYTSAVTVYGIYIGTGSGYTISNNIIGFANPAGTGTTNMIGLSAGSLTGTFPSAFGIGGTAVALRYVGINCLFTTGGTVSSLQNNTIAGFAMYSSSNAGTGNGVFCGISVASGPANVGTTTGNTIGSTTTQGSIYMCSTGGGAAVVGINCTSTNTVDIRNSNIGGIDAVGTSATISGAFTGIDASGSGSVTMTSNRIGSGVADNIRVGYTLSGGSLSNAGTLTATSGAGALVGLRSSGTGAIIVMSSNTLRYWVSSSTGASAFTGITNTGAATSSVTISSNLIAPFGQEWLRIAFASSATVTGINASAIPGTATLTITNNSFRGITHSANGSGAHTYITWSHPLSGVTDNINSNTFNALSLATSGSVTFLNRATTSALSATSTLNVNSNSIGTSFAKTVAGGTVTFYTNGIGAASVNGAIENETFNNFSNVTLTGATAVTLWSNSDGASNTNGPTKNITNNTFNNITTGAAQITGITYNFSGNNTSVSNNTITNLTGGGVILAINSGTSNFGTHTINSNTLTNFTTLGQMNVIQIGAYTGVTTNNISNNTVRALSTSGAANAVFGVIASGGTNNIFKNKIADLSSDNAGATMFGILVQTGGTYNIYNNLVGDLRTPSATGFNVIQGISIGGSVTANVYYNTVYLNASSTSVTTFGNSCVSFSSTTTALNMRNNVLVNLSTPAQNGSNNAANGVVAALRRTAGTTGVPPTNYGNLSNNNSLWSNPTAGTNNHLTYVEGNTATVTNPQNTLSAFRSFMATRDQFSVAENPNFLSVTAANANFLHINTAIATQLESKAVNIASFTDDYDGDIRQGNPGYAGTGTAPDMGADEFEGIALDATPPAISYTVFANTSCTTDRTLTADIVDGSGVNVTPGTKPRLYFKKSSEANTYVGNTSADNGWKYVEATNASSPFSFTTNFSLLTSPVVSGDNIQYFVVAQDNVTPVPNVGINNGTFAATPASVNLTATEFPIGGTINSFSVVTAIPTTVTIGAAGTYTTLTGAGGLFAAINTNGLSANTTATIIDASITETGATALNPIIYGCGGTFTLTIKPAPGVSPVLTGSVAGALINLNGASFVTIDGDNGSGLKNLTIDNTNAGASQTILLANGASSNIIRNCVIKGATTGFGTITFGSTLGLASANNDNVVQNNDITQSSTLPIIAIYNVGLVGRPNSNNVITGNRIFDFSSTAFVDGNGAVAGFSNNTQFSYNNIFQTGARTTTIGGILLNNTLGITNMFIFKNTIRDMSTTFSTSGTVAAYGMNLFGAASVNVNNNMVSMANNTGEIWGIADQLPLGSTLSVSYNTVSMTGSLATARASYAFIKSFSAVGETIRNNIFSNTRLCSNTSKQYAIFTATVGTYTSNYNDLYSAGNAQNVLGLAVATDQATLAAWQTATLGQDLNSVSILPVFTAVNDLHLTAANNCGLDGKATPISITTDIDDQARDVTTPDMGADEFTPTLSTTLYNTLSTTVCDSRGVDPSGVTFHNDVCNPLARVVPSGGSPVTGRINTCVYISPLTNPTFNAEPYVQRHFDIEPATGASTATATVTLYFTDAEFVTFNANNAAFPDLPTVGGGGNTDPNIANVRITQYHGTPTTTPSSPGNYTVAGGAGVRINPAGITTNYNANYWEVTFPVTGFSGFYLHTNVNYALPITMNYFRGSRQGTNHLLNWKVTCNSTPRATLTLERSGSANGGFTAINTIDATAARCNQPFDYTDARPLNGMNYYRVKMTDADGKVTYSGIVALLNATKGFEIVGIAPNPVVGGNFKLNVTSANTGRMDVVISDLQGRIVQRGNVTLTAGFSAIDMNVNNLASGTYNLVGITPEGKSTTIRFVKN